MPWGILLCRHWSYGLGLPCSRREARAMHAPRQEVTGGHDGPQGGRTAKLRRVWVGNETSYACWSCMLATATPDTLSTAKTPCQYPGQNVRCSRIACVYEFWNIFSS
jgi:hypothetical protein